MDETVKAELLADLKAQGLDVAEDALKGIVEAVFGAVEKLIQASPNKYDDMLLAFLPLAKPMVLELVDKVDGQVG
jgi:hypothetical protein